MTHGFGVTSAGDHAQETHSSQSTTLSSPLEVYLQIHQSTITLMETLAPASLTITAMDHAIAAGPGQLTTQLSGPPQTLPADAKHENANKSLYKPHHNRP